VDAWLSARAAYDLAREVFSPEQTSILTDAELGNYTDTIGFKVSKDGLSFSGPWLQEYKFERYVLVNLATPRLMSPCMPEALISPSTSMVLDPKWLIAHGSPLK
jgi:hypothetical protein